MGLRILVRPSSLFTSSYNSDVKKHWPYFGLVQGRDDYNSKLGHDNWQYGYLTATKRTAPSSRPKNVGNTFSAHYHKHRTSLSHVWTLSKDGALKPEWINSDGSKPNIQVWTQGGNLLFGGDIKEFRMYYTNASHLVKLRFVEKN
ncbi:hypothetical protein BT69DRAFT_1355599 [Atractiella rhizophila]|nr:hypothetical protein BT69DRAFT_1355599 [Atractiella rhizophila]